MIIDATFWVSISFFIFFGGLIYLKVPQKINNSLNNQINEIKKEIEEAEKIRETFSGLENLRNAHGPIPVLHHAVALADIAKTGPQLPLMAGLDSDLMGPIRNAAATLMEGAR